GCRGGKVDYSPEEIKKNVVNVIHLETGMVVGYPPCPRIDYFTRFIPEKYGIEVVVGTHPIPQKYYTTHMSLGTWKGEAMQQFIKSVLADEKMRLAYD
ncbi:MAG TPA: CGGC domain-containing protein, partial [Bacteroidales bacterium]|nr:CGGC domain-containing protein [Bacteroidales bacterium]